MKSDLMLHDKPAVKINAELIRPGERAGYYNCEGDYVWVPDSVSCYGCIDKTLLIEEWFYNKLVQEGKL